MTRPLAGERKIYVTRGEHAISGDSQAVISTILGSCVAVCLWDPLQGQGGMNHFLLPEDAGGGGSRSFGAQAMEALVNDLMKAGADKRRLRAKVFGGAAVVEGLSDIGARNSAFASAYLRAEGIPCDAFSTGGVLARHLRFWPVDGQARQRFVRDTSPDVQVAEAALRKARGNPVELF